MNPSDIQSTKLAINPRTAGLQYTDPEVAEYRFDSVNKACADYLATNGFVVIKNVFTKQEIKHSKRLLWEFLSNIGWNEYNPKTWTNDRFPGEYTHGIFWGNGAGQSKFQWHTRTIPKVIQSFVDIWNAQNCCTSKNINLTANDMLTSFDGFNIFRPWHLNEDWKTTTGWFHIDQNVMRAPNIETIQGIVSLYDETYISGSTVFVAGSHKLVQKMLRPHLTLSRGDFVPIPKRIMKNNFHLRRRILLCCKAGDLTLWDSRCIHCSSPSLLNMKEMKEYFMQSMMRYPNINQNVNNNNFSDEEKNYNKKKTENILNPMKKQFIHKMKEEYLKPKQRKLFGNDLNLLDYNGYKVRIILWEQFNKEIFVDGNNYLIMLPWNTSLLWIFQYFDDCCLKQLQNIVHNECQFVDNKNESNNNILSGIQARGCIISNDEYDGDDHNIPVIPLNEWSELLMEHVSKTCSTDFNSIFVGFSNDENEEMVAFLSLSNTKNTFLFKSKKNNSNAERYYLHFEVPLVNGSLLMMSEGFDNHWMKKYVMKDGNENSIIKFCKNESEQNWNTSKTVDFLRAVSYVCMVPKFKIKDDEIETIIEGRIKAYENHCTCSHWPQKNLVLHRQMNMKSQSILDATEMQKSLIGCDLLSN